MLEINKAVFGYTGKNKRKTVLENVSFSLDKGELLCILGANGVGKTTMYRTILGFLPLLEGELLVDGRDIRQIPREQLAKHIAYVPQYHTPPFAYSVYDVVLMGRGTHISRFSSPGRKDELIALEMLERMGISHLRDDVYTEISGGERQLVLIARALAQQTEYILMDEPAAPARRDKESDERRDRRRIHDSLSRPRIHRRRFGAGTGGQRQMVIRHRRRSDDRGSAAAHVRCRRVDTCAYRQGWQTDKAYNSRDRLTVS